MINAKEPMQNVAVSRKSRRTYLGPVRIQNLFAGSLLLVLLFGCILLGCRSTKPPQTPTIEFTKIPPAAQGGRERGGDQHYREMDMEISKWGDAERKNNAQYGIQPFFVPGNVAPFVAPSGTLTHSLHWESGRASFKTVRGSSIKPGAPVVFEHVFTSGVPTPGQETFQLLFYTVASEKSPMKKENEVVVEKFEYFP